MNAGLSGGSFGEIGAGIVMWPRVLDTLEAFGLGNDLKSKDTSLAGNSTSARGVQNTA